jgi:protein TonB
MTEPYAQHDDTTDTDEQRRPYRPPVGMPLRGEGRWGAPFSLVVHVVLIMLLVTPLFARVVAPELFPGGGLGPAGGGGGGRGGAGGWRREPITPERLRYMRIAPEPPPAETAEPAAEAVLPPKEETPPPQPDPPVEQAPPEQSAPAAAPVPGTGGGTGNDGTSGTGPGTGGGTGSGVGTGTGSSTGPGTGGGEGQAYMPTPDLVVLTPHPVPRKARGKRVVATFEVDARGNVVRFHFTPTGDRDFDRRLRDLFSEYRFRPAVDDEGRPIPGVWRTEITLGSSG